MKLDRRVLLIDRVNRLTGGGLGVTDPRRIQRQRRSRVPDLPLVGGLLERVVEAVVTGVPRSGVAIDQIQVPGPASTIPVRRYRPAGASPVAPMVVYFHGGGWTTGSPRLYDWVCTTIAADAAAVVVAPDYRKAPEHPAPAAVDDAVAATTWLAEHAAEVGATGPVVVGGDSAGGNLAALVAIAARDAGAPAIAGQVLLYPATDLTATQPSIDRLADAPILPKQAIDAHRNHYLAGMDGHDPAVSPLYVEDLTGVAPALVQTAEHDPLVDEGRAFADRLAGAGVTVRHTQYVGVPHGYISMPGVCPVAHQAVAEIVQFIADGGFHAS